MAATSVIKRDSHCHSYNMRPAETTHERRTSVTEETGTVFSYSVFLDNQHNRKPWDCSWVQMRFPELGP